MSPASASPEPGSAVNVLAAAPAIPDYELVRIVGRGSFGDVWLARSVTGSWRAIKVVWRERFTDAEPFEREFRGLKEFADVSVGESSQMALLHVGRNDAAGFFFSVMELADDAERGRHIDPATYVPLTLAEMRTRRGRIPADECARLGSDLARALATLHRRGLVHRDVKPSNVILVNGAPKLADIGLVAPAASARTFVGTEGYVPPDGPGTPGADIFALGKLLYELSTGHDRQEFPRLPAGLAGFPDRRELLELNEVIVRACAPTPAERYRDGAAILADLTALHGGVSLRTRRFAGFALRSAAALGLAAAVGAVGWYWATRPVPAPTPVAAGISPRSVAVLPFVDTTKGLPQDYFSFGISDEILQALAREGELRVTGSRSSFWAGNQKFPAVELARALRVAFLVEGSLHRDGSRLRVDLRLTRGFDGVSESLGTFERDVREVFALQDEVARAIATKVLGRVTMPVLAPTTNHPEAYDAFLQGRFVQMGRVSRAPEAVKHFERAVALDPGFAVAWARLAEARHRDEGVMDARNSAPEHSVPTADHALALQPDLPLAWIVSGYARGVGLGDSARGLSELARAEKLGGPNADTLLTRFLIAYFAGESRGLLPLAREAVACNPENVERNTIVQMAMSYLGDFAEADRLYQRSIAGEGGEPSNTAHAHRLHMRRRWRGAEAAQRLFERSPSDRPELLPLRVQLLAAVGRVDEAARLLEGVTTPVTLDVYLDAGLVDRARTVAEARLPELRRRFEARQQMPVRTENRSDHTETARADLVLAEYLLGDHESALARLEIVRRQVEFQPANRRAVSNAGRRMPGLYAMLGRPEVALELLRQNMTDGYCPGYELRDTPGYESLHDDPAFLELRRQAEAWADMQPDPLDDPAPAVPPER